MCGLAGLFLPSTARMAKADLDAMLRSIRHRGPDGQGQYISDDRRYQAGFNRLAIIDLETGDQPIREEGGRQVLMGNGEIYNYRELRALAATRDYPYRTTGDMEVILPLFRAFGDEFIKYINGMFALALYDGERHRLTLVRDRLGIKPLYWAEVAGGGILFASEIKALFASGLLDPAVDEAAVAAYLAHGYVPAPGTLYRGINKLPAGHMLTCDADGRINLQQYWKAAPAADLPSDPGDIADHLTALLSDSIRLQLRSDVPVGALLSGGIDSGLMTALAAGHLEAPLNTFTVRFEGAPVDEAPLAEMVADRYGTNHTTLDVSAQDAAGLLPKLAWYSDEPLFDPSLLPNYLVEEALGQHVKVALNGSGGDELFAGYGRYFPLPVEQRYLTLPRWLRAGLVEPAVKIASPMTAWKLARAEKFESDRGAYLFDHSTYFPEPLRNLIGSKLPSSPSAQSRYFNEFDGPAQTAALYADLNSYLVEDPLHLLDRTSMAVSVEGRVPFLDHRLVEAAFAVPPDLRTPGGQQKALERRMAAPFLPDAVLSAPKQGFASPVPSWLKAGMAPTIERILTAKRTLERGWWSADGVKRLLADPARHGFRAYSLLMLELAVRIHVESPVSGTPPSSSLEDFADAA